MGLAREGGVYRTLELQFPPIADPLEDACADCPKICSGPLPALIVVRFGHAGNSCGWLDVKDNSSGTTFSVDEAFITATVVELTQTP
ncbi:hypothetical protein AHiyo8_54940 [Arthrobacter sp. Hiyo8]|nr:hypothetical protein AHiyo8_54940 [Arthrobacter sp. Hiyo8]